MAGGAGRRVRVARRDRVGARGRAVRVDAQDFAVQEPQIGSGRAARAAVADGDVEVAVAAELELAAVVIAGSGLGRVIVKTCRRLARFAMLGFELT